MPESTTCLPTIITNSFKEALTNAFDQMVFLPVSIKDLTDKINGSPTGYISGSIGLSGFHNDNEIKAQFCLVFSHKTAERIFRSMMMMEETDPVEVEELRDVVGELANISAGGAKTILSEHGFKLSISLPTVVVGADHYLSSPAAVPFSKVLPVDLEAQTFYCEINIS